MSLFGSIQMAGNSLRANDIALQVVGQNIANANTPGYLREDLVLKPAATQKIGGLLLGMGVEVEAVIQKVDKFLEERLRGAVSDQSGDDVLQQTYTQLEGVLGELGDTDLSTSMNRFFNSISTILNQPDDKSIRNQAMLEGLTLTQDIQRISQRVESLRSDVNERVSNIAGNINQLTEKIADLNVKISELQGGSVSKSDAVGLTDQRANALEELASLINTNSVEQPDGTMTVYCGGDFLVFAGVSREVEVVLEGESGFSTAQIQLADTHNVLESTSGELRGLLDSRDTVLNGFLDEFNDFSKTLAYEFNKVYSSGQGLSGYDTLTSAYAVDDASQALDSAEAGLTFTPKNGSFEVLVRNTKTGLTTTTNVQVNLSGLGHQTTLEDLKTALNGINGIEAEILVGGQLKITSKSTDSEFSFADDTSGVLAALGVNVFFTGISSRDIGISEYVQDDASLFAASSGGLGVDTKNAEILAQFLDHPIESHNGKTLEVMYNSLMAGVAQGASVAKSAADGAKAFSQSLRGEKMAISGVNLDEEAVRMITYQRTYQASAKFIATVSELLQILVSI